MPVGPRGYEPRPPELTLHNVDKSGPGGEGLRLRFTRNIDYDSSSPHDLGELWVPIPAELGVEKYKHVMTPLGAHATRGAVGGRPNVRLAEHGFGQLSWQVSANVNEGDLLVIDSDEVVNEGTVLGEEFMIGESDIPGVDHDLQAARYIPPGTYLGDTHLDVREQLRRMTVEQQLELVDKYGGPLLVRLAMMEERIEGMTGDYNFDENPTTESVRGGDQRSPNTDPRIRGLWVPREGEGLNAGDNVRAFYAEYDPTKQDAPTDGLMEEGVVVHVGSFGIGTPRPEDPYFVPAA